MPRPKFPRKENLTFPADVQERQEVAETVAAELWWLVHSHGKLERCYISTLIQPYILLWREKTSVGNRWLMSHDWPVVASDRPNG